MNFFFFFRTYFEIWIQIATPKKKKKKKKNHGSPPPSPFFFFFFEGGREGGFSLSLFFLFSLSLSLSHFLSRLNFFLKKKRKQLLLFPSPFLLFVPSFPSFLLPPPLSLLPRRRLTFLSLFSLSSLSLLF